MGDQATLTIDGKSYEFPVVVGSEGEQAIDIRKLRQTTGYITLDPGFANTGACESAITFIDGEKGVLRYRGIPIEQLAEHSTFLETSHLLIHGHLPTAEELRRVEREICYHTMLHEDMRRFFDSFPKNAHPMAVSSAALSALSTFYPPVLDLGEPENLALTVSRLLAKMPTIAAFAYKHSLGQPFMYPDNRLDYPSNFLHLMFATPCEPYIVDPKVAEVVDLLHQHRATGRQLPRQPVRLPVSRVQGAMGITARRCQSIRHRDAREHRRR
jgi:citrate synthase